MRTQRLPDCEAVYLSRSYGMHDAWKPHMCASRPVSAACLLMFDALQTLHAMHYQLLCLWSSDISAVLNWCRSLHALDPSRQASLAVAVYIPTMTFHRHCVCKSAT